MSEQALPDLVAAVDLGSNSFHMKVARVVDAQLQVVDRLREMVRLAAGLDEDNRLTPEATTRAIDCLERFGQRLREVPPEDVRVVGTNTLRRARNAHEFIAEAEAALGHPIEIIAGIEEARLIYLGVAHATAQDEQQRLVMDIGGGSTEVIIGQHLQPLQLESLYMGCVGLSNRFFADGKIKRRNMRQAELYAEQELEPIQELYRRVGWDAAVGASGTIRAAAEVIRAQGWGDGGITPDGLAALHDALIEIGSVHELASIGVQAERAPVFPGGIAILLAALRGLRIKRMTVSNGALREGVLYDLLGRLGDEDVREMTIRNLCTRYRIDTEQGGRVDKTALYLRDQVSKSWRLRKSKHGNLLSWAARLHEMGLDIAHAQYHRHGAYLLAHSDLAGFSQQEQETLAVLVRCHRRKFPVEAFERLPRKSGESCLHLAVLLRLAVILHRSRTDTDLPGIVADAQPGALRLAFPPGWIDAQPLTGSELAEEVSYLKPAGIVLSFA